jgi:hypothetical protein
MSSRNQKLEQQVKIMFYLVFVLFLARGERKFLGLFGEFSTGENERKRKIEVATRKRPFGRDG